MEETDRGLMNRDEALKIKLSYALKSLGLSAFEQSAYSYLLLSGGWESAQEISTHTDVPLTRVYSVLKQLAKKRLISINKLSNPIKYCINDPSSSLRFLFREHVRNLNDEAERLDRVLEDLIKDVKSPERHHFYSWEVYHGEEIVYKSLIPSLIKASRREVVIVGKNVSQTMSKEFLEEFYKAINRGITFKCLVPPDTKLIPQDPFKVLKRGLGLVKLTELTRRYWAKNIFIRQNELNNVPPFGIFDIFRVGFSIASPVDGRYLVTLVTDAKDVAEDFYKIFQTLWESSIELEVPSILAKILKIK